MSIAAPHSTGTLSPFLNGAPIVYDVGMHNGDDSQYYLEKGLNVVGVDANPEMCAIAQDRFSLEISQGRLKIVCAGLTDRQGSAEFYINEAEPAISTFVPQAFDKFSWAIPAWKKIFVETFLLTSLIDRIGPAYYIKIDIEFSDVKVLNDLRTAGVAPPFISVEMHDILAFELLKGMGYSKFQIVDGASVAKRFAGTSVVRVDGARFCRDFLPSSSGPCGNDLPNEWIGGAEVSCIIDDRGPGWFDIHAMA